MMGIAECIVTCVGIIAGAAVVISIFYFLTK